MEDVVSVFVADVRQDGGPHLTAADGPIDVALIAELSDTKDLPASVGVTPLNDADGGADERYTLRIDSNGVRVRAVSPAGAYRGLTTLRQLIVAAEPASSGTGVLLPGVEIVDGPRIGWRSFDLDAARSPYSVDEEACRWA